MKETLKEYYRKWLIYSFNLENQRKWWKVMGILDEIPFHSPMDRDKNRIKDGWRLRLSFQIPEKMEDWREEIENFLQKEPVSVLEVLLGLSKRVEKELIGETEDPHPEYFFLELCKNMNLLELSEVEIRRAVSKWMKRTGKKNGFGGPFPVKSKEIDQNQREIWDQMNAYLSETYYVGKYSKGDWR